MGLAGAVVLNKVGTVYEGRGWPDLWIAHPLWTGWLELKVKAPVSRWQQERMALIRAAGVPAFVVRLVDLEEFYAPGGARFVFGKGYGRPDAKRGLERLKLLSGLGVCT